MSGISNTTHYEAISNYEPFKAPNNSQEFQAFMLWPNRILILVNFLAVLVVGALFITHKIQTANVYTVWLLTFITLLSGGLRIYFGEYLIEKSTDSSTLLGLTALVVWILWFMWATLNVITSIVSISTSQGFSITLNL